MKECWLSRNVGCLLLRSVTVKECWRRAALRWHSVLGSDEFATMLRRHAAKHAIQLHARTMVEGPTGVCIVLSGSIAVAYLDRQNLT